MAYFLSTFFKTTAPKVKQHPQGLEVALFLNQEDTCRLSYHLHAAPGATTFVSQLQRQDTESSHADIVYNFSSQLHTNKKPNLLDSDMHNFCFCVPFLYFILSLLCD